MKPWMSNPVDSLLTREPRGELSREVIFELLRNQRRRYILHYLKQQEEQVPLQELVEQVAAWENDVPVTDVSSKEHQRVYVALVQTHLPRMESADVITYEENRGTVELSDVAADFDFYLDIVPKGDIAWGEYYLWIASFAGALLLLVWVDMPPFTALPDLFWTFFVAGVLGLAAVGHYWYHRRTRLGTEGPPGK